MKANRLVNTRERGTGQRIYFDFGKILTKINVDTTLWQIFSLYRSTYHQKNYFSLYLAPKASQSKGLSLQDSVPPGEWYDQERDEWVILLRGTAELRARDNRIELNQGDYLYIPAHQKHRVEYTSSDPACIWLAIHFKSE